ncbi:hypothetical protein GLOIN_2v1786427 [Rhizophagus clarus]|nr:hypothetical protein GLOIN_2v1786427 [Rhizophagus clarus]
MNCTYDDKECKLDEYRYHHNMPDCTYYTFSFEENTEIKIYPSITEVYLDGLVLGDKYYPPSKLSPRQTLPIMSEQTIIIYYSVTISKLIVDNYAYGLVGGNEKEYVDFNAHTDHISASNAPYAPTLILIPTSTYIYYQEESYYDIGSIISNVGGFFSSLSGIFVFLFGATKLAPWGFLQTHVFNCLCTRYQERLKGKIKIKYTKPIPFISGREKITLEERVQSIENILKEYYLDTSFLKSLIDDIKVEDKV